MKPSRRVGLAEHWHDMEAYRQHTPIVVDDLVSSAQTMVETVKGLVAAGLRTPVCVAVRRLR